MFKRHRQRPRWAYFIGLVGLLLAPLLHAQELQEPETVLSVDGYEIHYNLFDTTLLQPDVASRYGITRANNRAMINISVRRQLDGSQTEAVTAEIEGIRSDLIRQTPLEFQVVTEPGAIYYLSSFKHQNHDLLTFRIQVKPEGASRAYPIEFTRTLYVD